MVIYLSRKKGLLFDNADMTIRCIRDKPLWHTIVDKNMKKEDQRIAAGLTTNMIVNVDKNKGVNMETAAKICDAFRCGIPDVIELINELSVEETKE